MSARAGYRMTFTELELPDWNKVHQRDKLIGCSLTGWQDMVNACNLTREDQAALLKELREAARNAAFEYADELGRERPILVTTVKPEGSLSLLPTVSSGVHYSHAPYYIRRIRISASDPLVKVCEELGYPVFPEVGQDPETCVTKVVEFPVKAPEGKVKPQVSALEQLENYKMFMENYVDHNCSITVHVKIMNGTMWNSGSGTTGTKRLLSPSCHTTIASMRCYHLGPFPRKNMKESGRNENVFLCFLRSTKERKQTLISEMMVMKAVARLGKHKLRESCHRLSLFLRYFYT